MTDGRSTWINGMNTISAIVFVLLASADSKDAGIRPYKFSYVDNADSPRGSGLTNPRYGATYIEQNGLESGMYKFAQGLSAEEDGAENPSIYDLDSENEEPADANVQQSVEPKSSRTFSLLPSTNRLGKRDDRKRAKMAYAMPSYKPAVSMSRYKPPMTRYMPRPAKVPAYMAKPVQMPMYMAKPVQMPTYMMPKPAQMPTYMMAKPAQMPVKPARTPSYASKPARVPSYMAQPMMNYQSKPVSMPHYMMPTYQQPKPAAPMPSYHPQPMLYQPKPKPAAPIPSYHPQPMLYQPKPKPAQMTSYQPKPMTYQPQPAPKPSYPPKPVQTNSYAMYMAPQAQPAPKPLSYMSAMTRYMAKPVMTSSHTAKPAETSQPMTYMQLMGYSMPSNSMSTFYSSMMDHQEKDEEPSYDHIMCQQMPDTFCYGRESGHFTHPGSESCFVQCDMNGRAYSKACAPGTAWRGSGDGAPSDFNLCY